MSYALDDFRSIHARLTAAGLLNAGPLAIAVRNNESSYSQIMFSADGSADENPEQQLRSIPGKADVFGSVLAKRADIGTLLYLFPRYCGEVSGTMDLLPACLDDMAQIVGINARVAEAFSPPEVCGALRGRSACLTREGRMLATGRTLNEAFVAALVLEKGARTFVLGKTLGGAKPVPPLAARLMRFAYQKKYSKINLEQEAKKGAA